MDTKITKDVEVGIDTSVLESVTTRLEGVITAEGRFVPYQVSRDASPVIERVRTKIKHRHGK